MLQQAGRGRENDVGRGRAEDDQVQLRSLDPGRFHGARGGMKCQVTGGFANGGLASLTDAGARTNPLVTGLDEFFEIRVGDDLFRQIAASARNA